MLGGLRSRLARLSKLIGPAAGPAIDPRLARAFLHAVPDCGCDHRAHVCGRFVRREADSDPPDPDEAWLAPAWRALEAAERRIAADPDWQPTDDEDPDEDDDESDDDGAL